MRTGKKFAACLISLLAASSVMMTGCAKRSIEASVAAEIGGGDPDMEIHDDIVLDYDEAQESCEEVLTDEEEYPLNSYIDTFVDEEAKTVVLIWPLLNEATEKDGVKYANAFIRQFNDACADQDFSIARSTQDSFGGLYEKYSVNIQVFREEDMMDPDNYLVSMTIDPGQPQVVVPWSQYDGINAVSLTDGYYLFAGGAYSGDRDKIDEVYKATHTQ